MHPFSLNEEEIGQVGGGLSIGDGTVSSMMYGEEGGQPPVELPAPNPPYTSMVYGEEGGGTLPGDPGTV